MGKFTSWLTLGILLGISPRLHAANPRELQRDSIRKMNLTVDYQGFLDNREFTQVNNQIPTTFFGHRLELAAHLYLDSTSQLTIGINPLQEFGSPSLFSFTQPTIYLQKEGKNHRFLFGSFPRILAIGVLPRAFFSDTIAYYRPNVTGLSYTFRKKKSEFSGWIDWTSQKTNTQREHFFVGVSSKTALNKISILFYSHLSHLANNANGFPQKPLEESLMNYLEFRHLFELNRSWSYQPSISVLHSIERVRDSSPTRSATSILIENAMSYRSIEVKHTLKRGMSHFTYSGDPFYQYANYGRLDLLLQTQKIKGLHIQGVYSIHFIEQRMVHQQKIAVSLKI